MDNKKNRKYFQVTQKKLHITHDLWLGHPSTQEQEPSPFSSLSRLSFIPFRSHLQPILTPRWNLCVSSPPDTSPSPEVIPWPLTWLPLFSPSLCPTTNTALAGSVRDYLWVPIILSLHRIHRLYLSRPTLTGKNRDHHDTSTFAQHLAIYKVLSKHDRV